VRVLDDDVTEKGEVFLVMELLEGAPLHERAAASGGKLSVEEVMLAADQLLEVLAAAHEKGIVHRDVKPENVFVTRDGEVKILDFGIARVCEAQPKRATATQAGVPMGTPAFMSPEQARGRWDLVGAESDLWSVAASMFTLLSGEFVHVEETVPELLAAVFTKPARSIATVMPDVPRELAAIIDRGLQLKLADRYCDALSMRADLQAAYQKIFGRSIPEPVRPRVHSSPPPRITGRDLSPRSVSTMATMETRVVPVSTRQKGAFLAMGAVVVIGVAAFFARPAAAVGNMAMSARAGSVSDVASDALLATGAGVIDKAAVQEAPKPKPLPPAKPQAGPTSKKSLFDRRF
jgi:serine/threonine-protein kinase